MIFSLLCAFEIQNSTAQEYRGAQTASKLSLGFLTPYPRRVSGSNHRGCKTSNNIVTTRNKGQVNLHCHSYDKLHYSCILCNHDLIFVTDHACRVPSSYFTNAHKLHFGKRKEKLTRWVSVEDEVVSCATREIADLVFLRQSNNAGTKRSWGNLALKSKEVGSETSNMGSSHGGTRDGVLQNSVNSLLEARVEK